MTCTEKQTEKPTEHQLWQATPGARKYCELRKVHGKGHQEPGEVTDTPVGSTWERAIEGDCDLGELVRVTRNSRGDLYFCAAENFDLPLHRRCIHLCERGWFIAHYTRKD